MKVLCKEDYIITDGEELNFFKNRFYDVYIDYENCCWIHNKVSIQKFLKIKYTTHDHYNRGDIFENYFYTIEESRKLKLQKINEI